MSYDIRRKALGLALIGLILGGCGGSQAALVPPVGAPSGSSPRNVARSASAYHVLYSFKGGPKDGKAPMGSLVDVGGALYGITSIGGIAKCYGPSWGCGTVFTISAAGKEQVLYRFHPPGPLYPSGVIHVGNTIYGLSGGGGVGDCGAGSRGGCGTVFAMSTSGLERTVYSFKGKEDGSQPLAAPIYFEGKLYGTASRDGIRGDGGVVFEVDLSGKLRVLHSFTGGKDGLGPASSLIDVAGEFYGTTTTGGGAKWCSAAIGTDGCGTVFAVTKSGTERVVYRFRGNRDGAYPQDGVVQLNGLLYGTTFFGGAGTYCPAGCGTVFEVDPSSGRERVIYAFKGNGDGDLPASELLPYHGTLYGTTPYGGTGNQGPCSVSGLGHCGTIYRVSPSGSERVLYDFQGPNDGNRPIIGHLLEVGGTFYGTTNLGGSHCHPELGCGTVFAFKP